MFYLPDLVKKKTGKFGDIWLAAVAPKCTNRRALAGVDIVESAEDIIDIVNAPSSTSGPSTSRRRHERYSLYLSSQLMYGLTKAHQAQVDMLLEDCQKLMGSLSSKPSSETELQDPTSKFRVTFPEPDFENAPPDFGCLSLEHFTLHTPSPEHWEIRPGLPERAESLPEVADTHLTVRFEDITFPEVDAQIPVQVPEVDLLEDEPFVFPPRESVPEPPAISTPQPQAEPEVVPERLETAQLLPQPQAEPAVVSEQLETTQPPPEPTVPETEEPVVGDQRFPDVPATTPEPTQPRQDLPPQDDGVSPEQRARRTLRQASHESSLGLQPAPAPAPARRRRRGRNLLIIDTRITLSQYEMRRNIDTANERLVRPLILPSLQETAEAMLSRFGLRAAARGNRRFWPHLRTLPEPNDPSRYGSFRERSPEVSQATPMLEVSEPLDATAGEGTSERRIEDPRVEVTHDETHEISAAGSKSTLLSLRQSRLLQSEEGTPLPGAAGISSLLQMLDMPSGSASHLDVEAGLGETVVSEPQFEEPEIPEGPFEPEIPRGPFEPEIPGRQFEPEARRETSDLRRESYEERTPPPASPDVPTSPLVDRVMLYIKNMFEENPHLEVISFRDVISKTPMTRMYVAKMFKMILNLHAASVIYIEQPEPGGDIFISVGPNFNAF